MTKKSFDYYDGKTLLNGYVSFNESIPDPKPAVLICPDWTGRSPFTDSKADQLAALGYVGCSLDIYGRGQSGQTKDEKNALMQPFLQDRAMLRQRLLAAFNAVCELKEVNPQQIAIIGFCFGGLCALDLARSGAALRGAVSFHGILTPPKLTPATIRAKVLVLHGYDDPMVRPDAVNAFATEMTQAAVDWQVHLYGGHTLHAFTNPQAHDPEFGTVYNEIADQRSWRALCDFLQEVFNPSTTSTK